MKFSVIIPAYNCEKTLEAAVESVRASGLPDYEILLIDDGSQDGTPALCDRLCAQMPEVRCIHQENAGVSAARNRGITAAQGEYLWFVDADDTVDAGALTHTAEIALEQQPDMLIFGLSFDYYHRGKCYRREELVWPHERMLSAAELRGVFQELYACNALTPVWNKLFRRAVIVESGVRFDENRILMEDYLFVLDMLAYCTRVYCLPEVIYRYRQGDGWKNAYRRLSKISDLAAYLTPFEMRLERLGIYNREKHMSDFYLMLLDQKLHCASLHEIRSILEVHKQGYYADVPVETSALKIYLQKREMRLRNKIGVCIKTIQAPEVWHRRMDMQKVTDYQKDLYRYYAGKPSLQQRLMMLPEIRYLKRFRAYQSSQNAVFKKWNSYWLMRLSRKTQIQIPGSTKIGPGFYIGHFGRVIINPETVIGKNVNIATGVTIGQENRGERKGCPEIGDRVWIGTNAVIVGRIHIGTDVLIAPLSYVNFNVPDHSIVIGNPARVIHCDNATEGYIERTVK